MASLTRVRGNVGQGNGLGDGVACTVALGAAPSSSNVLVLRVGCFMRDRLSLIVTDDQGNTWTQQAFALVSRVVVGIWTCSNPAAANPTVSIKQDTTTGVNAGTWYISAILEEYSGRHATLIECAGATATGISAAPSVNLADSANDCLKLGVCSWYAASPTGSAGTGWTIGASTVNDNAVQATCCIYRDATGTDTTDPLWSLSASDQWFAAAVAIRAAASGTTYNDSVSEGLTLGESQASALTAVATRSEGVTLGDSQAAARITAVTLGESLTLGDSLSAGLIYTDSLSEGVIVGADYAAAAVQAAALSEGLTLDAHHATAQTFVEALSAGVTLGDGLAPGLVLAATLAEAVTFGDNFASTVTKDETIAESVTLGDGFAATLAAVGTVSEGLTFGADLLAAATYPAALSEGVTLGVSLVDEHIQGGVYNDTLGETLALDASFSTTLVAGAVLAEGIVLDASFYTPPLGQSVRSGGGGGGRAWGWELDREVEEEMGTLLEGPPLTPATIEAVARRLDAPAESRIIGLKQPPVPAVSFDAAMVRRRRIRRRLLLLL